MNADRREPALPGKPVVDSACWIGSEIAARTDWMIELNSAELFDLKTMAASIGRGIGGDPNGLLMTTKEDFDLGAFAPKLERIKHDLKDGRGFALIRGLPLDEMTALEAAVIYWGIGRHLGTAVSNNPEGDMIGHVIDMGKDLNNPKHRGYQTNATMEYHCDQTSIVGLLCVQTARSGGESIIASSVAVYNELLKRRPDLIDILTKPYCWSKHGEVNSRDKGYYESPVFNFLDGYLCVALGSSHMIKGHKLEGAPAMTPRQMEAITAMEPICEELHYAMEFQRGDIQLLNNSVIFHTRTGFEDWPDPKKKRRLWRLWLTAPYMRPLTPYQAQHRNGIRIEGTKECINLEPLNLLG